MVCLVLYSQQAIIKNEVFFEAIKINTAFLCEIPNKLEGNIITAEEYHAIALKEIEKVGSVLKASGNGTIRIGKVAQKELTKN
jgi:hypothetical protein